ncbi:uncharacterized protein LOC133531121 isoform X2 [Cydia pomonella]|uniref:uncharacterized protein LOC133531121 isoform X2 n=1 Tax=Cydia pomonella TaxID=82600 RepID=UPI002ADE8700|nr:uncharacterized protein LOC133531121 isoform X2 [Cydia pomonella]
MYLLKAAVFIFILGECQPFKNFPLNSDFAKSAPFVEPPEHPYLKSWVSWVKSDDHQYDDYYNNGHHRPPKLTPPEPEGDNIRDLYSTLNELDKWGEFRRESTFLRQKYADSPKDDYHKQLLKNDLNEWVRQVKIQHARDMREQEERFSPYWNPEVLRTNLGIQENINQQFTTQKPRFDLQQQRMISGTQMMEMAIQRMENAVMAKTLRNDTFPATETKNTHRRSRFRINGRRRSLDVSF